MSTCGCDTVSAKGLPLEAYQRNIELAMARYDVAVVKCFARSDLDYGWLRFAGHVTFNWSDAKKNGELSIVFCLLCLHVRIDNDHRRWTCIGCFGYGRNNMTDSFTDNDIMRKARIAKSKRIWLNIMISSPVSDIQRHCSACLTQSYALMP